MGVCCFSYLIPYGYFCLQIKAVSTATGEGCFGRCCVSFILNILGLRCIAGAINRDKIRSIYGINGNFAADCAIWCYCYYCASCQEYNESKARGGPLPILLL